MEEFASMRLKRGMSVYVEAVQVFLDETTLLQPMDYMSLSIFIVIN